MSEKNSFIFYRSFYDALKTVSPSERAILYEAIAEYAFNQNEIEMPAICKGMFCLIKPQLQANHKKFIDGKKGSKYGKQGGRPKTPVGLKEETPKELFSETPNVNANVNVNDNVNVEYISLYSEILDKPILKVSDKRKLALKKFVKNYSLDDFRQGLLKVKESRFLSESKFCGFDWIIKEDNFIKIMEGNYANNAGNNSQYGFKNATGNKRSITDAVRAVDEAIARGEI